MWSVFTWNLIKFINAIIHLRIYKALLQETNSEPPQPRRNKVVLNNLQNAYSLFLGRIRTSKRSPFHLEWLAMEKAPRCLIDIVARGAKSWPETNGTNVGGVHLYYFEFNVSPRIRTTLIHVYVFQWNRSSCDTAVCNYRLFANLAWCLQSKQ